MYLECASTYLHVSVNIKHKGPLAKVGHDVVLLLLEPDDGVDFSFDVLEGDVLEGDSCDMLAMLPQTIFIPRLARQESTPLRQRQRNHPQGSQAGTYAARAHSW